jgi:hypothetical protein
MPADELIIAGRRVGEDALGNLNLTDIWRIAGSPSTKTTSNWRQLPTTDEYVLAVAQNLGKSYVKGKNDRESVIYSKSGKGGGAFAHILCAIAYAEYLDPALSVEVRVTYLRVRAGDLTLADEIRERGDASKKFQDTRDLSKLVRERFETTLADHDASNAIGQCTNAIYRVLLGGSKNEIVASRKLPAKIPFRDQLPLGELLQTINTEYLASDRIDDLNLRGKGPCVEASRRSAQIVREAFERERKDRREPEKDI